MTTLEFMRKHKGTSGKTRYCSSVMLGIDGVFYSYGYHYPLLFEVGGLWFVNDRGYSSSTSKHIGWARSLADCSVELPPLGEFDRADLSKQAILQLLQDQRVAQKAARDSHRIGTKIYDIEDRKLFEIDNDMLRLANHIN